MSLTELMATPEKYIPYGYYCYEFNRNQACPFWESKPGQYPKQEDGYCHFLGKSDWELNEESNKSAKIIYSHDGSMDDMLVSELEDDDDIDPVSGKKCHFPMSLLWDQCKECETNMQDPDDINLVTMTIGEKNE